LRLSIRPVTIAASLVIAVTVIIVVMPAVSHHTSIGNPDIERTFQAEADDRVSSDLDCSTADLTATNGPNDRTYDAVIAPRFSTVRIRLDGIAQPFATATPQQVLRY
jgi:hypothetical protein